VLATGVRARVPKWAPDSRGYHLLRLVEDAKRLHAALMEAASVLVVGAGFLGTEVAATPAPWVGASRSSMRWRRRCSNILAR